MQSRKYQLNWAMYNTTATPDEVVFHPGTGWFATDDIALIRAVFEAIAAETDFEVRPAIQFADAPGGIYTETSATATTTNSGYVEGDALYYPIDGYVSIATFAASNQWARLGFETRLKTGGSGQKWARIAGSFEILPRCG